MAGDTIFSLPLCVLGRWEDKSELFMDGRGKEIRSRAVVFIPMEVKISGYLYLGESSVVDPHDVVGSDEIKGFNKIPDIDGLNPEMRAFL